MELVAQIVVPILLVTSSGLFVKRGGVSVLVLPVVIAAFGAMWIYGALEHYQPYDRPRADRVDRVSLLDAGVGLRVRAERPPH
jgi:hypothetical protein